MKTSTSEGNPGIKWTAGILLDDLDLADDFVLLSHTHQQMQVKTISAPVGLNIHKGKSKILKYDTKNTNQIKPNRETLKQVSIVDKRGGADADVKAKTGNSRTAFLHLKNICNSKQLLTNFKVRVFNTNVKTVLLYRAEKWRTTTTVIKKVQVFPSNWLRKILNVRWSDTFINSLLRKRIDQFPDEEEIRERLGMWIGYTLKKSPNCISKHVPICNPEG
ncbi:hypothetical protein MS3_00000390 [Schistosoma haematobium]|uniref:DUF6451 domain-containing protein n=1 Tax=Schistosoma haematobium TaxID=6185 RepID=A0A922LG54_SCHHA|nr:hypothetical protein MS3_00000390 [Schistosoma haematobium]KAH9582589.1 hypothetical protein MS3_00000390 [Schistosoma haematobium]